jgi:hypothetical protein
MNNIKKLNRFLFKIATLFILLLVFLIGIVLTPSLVYATQTDIGNFTVYHNKPLPSEFKAELDEAEKFLQQSEIYDSNYKIDICLNDGSIYPALIQSFHSQAFGIGFYNKVVIMGNIDIENNYTEINGYRYNLSKLLSHEAIHCYQFNKFGLWKSNPLAKYPAWKWEGYNEYVSRMDQADLVTNISYYNDVVQKDKDKWGIDFADSTSVGRDYYSWWLLMQYCKDYKHLSYQQILTDTSSESDLRNEMELWWQNQK